MDIEDAERKGITFRFRLTGDERAEIEAAAAATGQKASEWARTVLLDAAKLAAQHQPKRTKKR